MFIVECGRGYSEALGRFDTFDCHVTHWTWLLALGVRYGWTPKGTVFRRRLDANQGSWPAEKKDYRPIDWYWAKVFFAADAASLAFALERALPDLREGRIDLCPSKPSFTLIIEGATEQELSEVNSSVRIDVVEALIEFLRRGEFYFAFDD